MPYSPKCLEGNSRQSLSRILHRIVPTRAEDGPSYRPASEGPSQHLGLPHKHAAPCRDPGRTPDAFLLAQSCCGTSREFDDPVCGIVKRTAALSDWRWLPWSKSLRSSSSTS